MATLLIAAVGPTLAQGTACTVDYTQVNDQLAKAKAAFASGDIKGGTAAVSQARILLNAIDSQCNNPQGAKSTDKLAACQYVFDATVRKGSDAGLNLHGQLALVENPADNTVVGYMVPRGFTPTAFNGGAQDKLISANFQEKTELVPVRGKVEGTKITMNFDLGGGKTIIGVGPMESTIAECNGSISGDLTGPASGDTGDWVGGADRAQCIARGIHNCVAAGGGNGSTACAIGVAQTCANTN